MLKLLRCRRGTAALVTVIALVPLIGFVALGGEAGSWYVTKQHAQNAADSAALSGALAIENSNSQPNFGTLNGLSSNNIVVIPGSYSTGSGFQSGGTSPNAVQAVITLCQPQSLSLVIYTSNCTDANGTHVKNVTIKAQAVASVEKLANPCVLALAGSISFQGSPNINAPNCGMASNSTANNAINFTGGGMSMNVGSLSAEGGCTGAASFCNTALTHMPPVTNPFSALDSVPMPTLSRCNGNSLTAYSTATPCTNNGLKLSGTNSSIQLNGVYFISGTLSLKGSVSLSGTALLILLPGASIDMKGNSGVIATTALASVNASQLPAALQPDASLLANMAIYDQSNSAITIGGTSQISFTGNMYLPNAAVTFQGNPTVNSCGELIAQSIAFNGDATFDNSGCQTNFGVSPPTSQYVRLVS